MSDKKLDQRAVNQIRILAADVVEKANSGHPGMPMGMAPAAHVLWHKIMNYSADNFKWPNRDRFVLSNGHGCALLYTMLHIAGYPKLTMDDLKQFRQEDSLTPGHPENNVTEGVEVTTGPLGQGIANAVGLAIAEQHVGAVFNRPGFNLIDHYTYVFLGDGCLQEGVSGEACSLAGHLGLNKLIVIYDDNHISIDGNTEVSFTEDVPKRYQAYGWNTITVERGDSDLEAIEKAIRAAQKSDKPTIISLKTTIGYGSSKQDTAGVHGSPLGKSDLAKVKEKFGFDPAKSFYVDPAISELYRQRKQQGAQKEKKWNELFAAYAQKYPAEAKEFQRRYDGKLPENWRAALPRYTPKDKPDATRNLSGIVLNAAAHVLPELIGGSADLTKSNMTALKGEKDFQKNCRIGRYLRFGVREHGMAAIGNGISAYGGLIPFTATFLNFIEYCFPSVRLSALSDLRQLYVMTHDSIGLGEDGPTHQPIEAISLCRATPNIVTFRPADGNETVGAYIHAIENKHGPTVFSLTRQNLPHLALSTPEKALLGGYVVYQTYEGKDRPDLIYVASGSEVAISMKAADLIKGKKVRVVSMPATELFDKQPVKYRREVLTPGVPVISVEVLSVWGWDRYSHHCIGMRTFGHSAPIDKLYSRFGFTPEKIVKSTQEFIEGAKKIAAENGVQFPSLLTAHYNASL